ncbi:helix-turn-helix domain-containing protein [Arenibacter sp. TNZ]|uniref:helix-turn-helix domain-containing protein n=1 Tax=Arenibacter TaxID=178469 RepID=UPI000CD3D0FD|nr:MULTISPECIES: helix-turn-helix transcriptional regulator [Arenibacter]MCM4170803.1 helix-turn-helix domain-containing protein [Arenibacter sp. TNZ]
MNKLDFGKELIKIRKARGLTQAEVAEKCNVTMRTIQRIESGAVKPRSSTIRIISESLEVDFFEISNQDSDFKSHTMFWYLKDLFNFKTNAMKKISILSTSILISTFIGINIFSTEAQSKTPKKEQKIELENQRRKVDFSKGFDEFKIKDNYVFVTKNNKHGLMTIDGKTIIPCVYDKLEFEGGYAITFKNQKRGLMNLYGKVIVPCEYDRFEVEGSYIVTLNGNKQGLMNLDGETIIPCIYNRFEVEGNFVFTLKDNKRGLMNLDGETIIPCEYHGFEIENNFVFVSKYNKHGLINLDGKVIIPCEYDTLKIAGSIAIVWIFW